MFYFADSDDDPDYEYEDDDEDEDDDYDNDDDYDDENDNDEYDIEEEQEEEQNCMGDKFEEKNEEEETHNDYVCDSSCAESQVFPKLCASKQENKISIQKAGKNSKGNIDNKKHACVFCEKLFPNIARHLEKKHKNEKEVVQILLEKKKSKERRAMWSALVNKGDFAHNFSVLEEGKGTIISKYRSKKEDPVVKDYLPCQYCRGFYKRDDLWRHQKSCKEFVNSQRRINVGPIRSGKLMLPTTQAKTPLSENVLSKMNDDNIKIAILSDNTIIEYGQRLYEEQGHLKHRHVYISQKMRELGRLLIKLRELNINSLVEGMRPSNWYKLIAGIQAVSDFNSETNEFGVPSLALKLGYSLKKCAENLHFKSMMEEDENDKVKLADDFLSMYEKGWHRSISAKALATLEKMKYNKCQILPLVEDVVLLNNHLTEKAEEYRNHSTITPGDYAEFAKICLAQIILFNRKRSGEAERMTIETYLNAKKGGEVDAVVQSTLTPFERKLCESHLRIEIVGKRNRRVPVLLTEKMKENIETLIKFRKLSEVQDQVYLFARPGRSQFPYRGTDCIRQFASECGAKHPETITSTKLRKQLATLAQILNLNETSQDILATFQGHDIRVHREYYRLQDNALQIAKVSKVLHALNNGSISMYKGCNFDEIEFEETGKKSY